MEIRIFRTLKALTDNKPFYVARVDRPDDFCYEESLRVFRSIYGNDVVIVFVCV